MIRLTFLLFFILVTVSSIECKAQMALEQSASLSQEIITGADQTEKYVPYLKGKRVSMVANQSSIIGEKSIVDSLLALGIRIVKVFGPEHGFRGNASNGAVVGDEKDAKTGLPIISLYGRNEKPTKEQLAGIDIMVFDIQDVGC
ncbi:MAG: DUF1343 domain-containing protein, partial [Sphingobacteriales bacterium]|nr:DUF1343 domain-containing protein [Sphingobacteriales bacterium]